MNEIKPFQPLQVPVAIALSAFAIIALTELHGLDPDSDSFDSFAALTAIVFWTISAGWPPTIHHKHKGLQAQHSLSPPSLVK